MKATPIEDHEYLERRVHVIEDELISFLEVMMLVDDTEVWRDGAKLMLETLKSLEGREEKPEASDFFMEWDDAA